MSDTDSYPFKVGDSIYHRKMDLFGRVVGVYPSHVFVQYEPPWDQTLEPSSVHVSELVNRDSIEEVYHSR